MTPLLAPIFERCATVQPTQPRGPSDVVAMSPAQPKQGERDLLAAVLASAINDLTGVGSVDRHTDRAALRARARQWIAGEPAPISFVALCELLGIDSGAARAALLADGVR